jgi:signal recognition particle receptor subunit beta
MVYIQFLAVKEQIDVSQPWFVYVQEAVTCFEHTYYYFQLQLWDTAGQERFRKSMVQHYYRNVHAVVIVYDVTKMSSFEVSPVFCIIRQEIIE